MKIKATIIIAALMLLISPVKSFAIPTLQLDIAGGTYDTSTQTIVASGDPFTLYALIIPNSSNTLSDTYYLSAAVLSIDPTASGVSSSADLGSFSINGTNINVTGDMVYGTPPIESQLSFQPGDLPKHGVFPTYYTELGFQFNSSDQISKYNTADRAIAGTPINLTPNSSGGMYYAAFTIDTSLLASTYYIHFDLYNTSTSGSNVYVTEFAPFSHDAQSQPVPEPSTLLLLGSGLIGFAVLRRKLKP